MATNFWQGRLVRLRAIEPTDWETHFHWNQDSDMERRVAQVNFPQSQAAVKRWADEAATRKPVEDAFEFAIEDRAGDKVGSIGTHHCDPRHGTFSYGVAIRPEHQRRGYAFDAILLVLRYYFHELRYQKATVTVYSFNEPSIRLHERLGFQLEGRLRRMIYTNGQYFDHLFFGLTREEFEARHPRPSALLERADPEHPGAPR